LKTAMNYTKYI